MHQAGPTPRTGPEVSEPSCAVSPHSICYLPPCTLRDRRLHPHFRGSARLCLPLGGPLSPSHGATSRSDEVSSKDAVTSLDGTARPHLPPL